MSALSLDLAEWLVDRGAGVSARTVLGDAPGRRANNLRERARGTTLQPGIHALVTLPDGAGVVLPLAVEAGLADRMDRAAREATERANELVRTVLGSSSIPAHGPLIPHSLLEIEGPSLGLPLLLAIVARFCATPVDRPILATGRLVAGGGIVPVGGMPGKLAAAAAEDGAGKLLLFPEATGPDVTVVTSVNEALAAVFGEAPLALEPGALRVSEWIERARQERHPARAIAMLQAVDREGLREPDRARVIIELGAHLRHAGRWDEAARLHADGRTLLARNARALGAEAIERYELSPHATAADAYRFDETIGALRERLSLPFASPANELRARGQLAQTLAMAGETREAIALRLENLPLHDLDEELGATRSGTLCCLALDSARAGDGSAFEEHAVELLKTTNEGNEHQLRYDGAALFRGLVALGRHADALGWARDTATLLGKRAPRPLRETVGSGAPVTLHPEISVLRALVRALRATGDLDDATHASSRAVDATTQGGLVGWLAHAVLLEAWLASSHDPDATVVEAHLSAMRALHAAATAFHFPGDTDPASIERGLDTIWY